MRVLTFATLVCLATMNLISHVQTVSGLTGSHTDSDRTYVQNDQRRDTTYRGSGRREMLAIPTVTGSPDLG